MTLGEKCTLEVILVFAGCAKDSPSNRETLRRMRRCLEVALEPWAAHKEAILARTVESGA